MVVYDGRYLANPWQELANALQNAQPKIQKMCEEDSEDHEAVAKLFEINDSIHRTIQRYKLFKKGDIEAANNIPQGTLGRSGAGVSQGPNNTLNLIDFGDPEPTPQAGASSQAQQQTPAAGNALEDDLLGLSLSGEAYGQSGSIALGGSNGSGKRIYSNFWLLLLTLLSSRSIWHGGAAKGNQPSHNRPLQCRTKVSSTASSIAPSIFLFNASPTAGSHTRPICCSRLYLSTSLTLPVSTIC